MSRAVRSVIRVTVAGCLAVIDEGHKNKNDRGGHQRTPGASADVHAEFFLDIDPLPIIAVSQSLHPDVVEHLVRAVPEGAYDLGSPRAPPAV